MSRDLTPGAAAIVGSDFAACFFLEILLDAPLYICTASDPIDWDGKTWIGVSQMGIGQVSEEAGEIQQMQFTLPAVPNEYLALALGTPTRGKSINLSLGVMRLADLGVEQMLPLWSGRIDTIDRKSVV